MMWKPVSALAVRHILQKLSAVGWVKTRLQGVRRLSGKPSMFVCIMLVLLQIRATQSAIQNFRFQKSSDCRGMALAAVDRYQTIRARGIVECVNFCGLDSMCLSVVFDTSTLQCCLGAVKAYQNCSNMEPASEEEVHLELVSINQREFTFHNLFVLCLDKSKWFTWTNMMHKFYGKL